jgi:hypothetical protein
MTGVLREMATTGVDPVPVISWDTSPAVAMTFLVNFGIFAGRNVSKIELERLGHVLLRVVDGVTLVSEHRFELAEGSSIDLHQVRVAIHRDVLPPDEPDIEALRVRIAEILEGWVLSCLTEVSGLEFTDAELDARDAVVEGVLEQLAPQHP